MTGTERIVVVGDGVVGRRVVRALGGPTVVERRAGRTAWIADGLSAGDVVVLATPAPHAPRAAELGALGISVVSVADDLDDTVELLALDDRFRDEQASLVVGAAMSPGLSGLLARHLADQLARADEIHVAVHATAGAACARQHHRALRGRSIGWHDHDWIERPAGSGRELAWFPEPVGARDCYRAELSDPLLLHRVFPEADRITARMSATRRDRLTARLPMLRAPHPEGGIGALRVEVRGADTTGRRETLVVGVAEFVGAATAGVAAAFASALARGFDGSAGTLPDGVLLAGDAGLPTRSLLGAVAAAGVRLQEFTGVAHA
jgi:hypothetical protein